MVSRSNILKICLMAQNTNFIFISFDGGRSYLTQLLPMVCRLQGRFQITKWKPWYQRSRSNILNIFSTAHNITPL